ncbi:MAG: hypothetical protein GWN58_66245, partial [Anaerolineae bacterium]|nr:hypothetical protein [Anaerolineae bacterium]
VQYREQALIEDLLAHIEAEGEEAPKASLPVQPKAPDRVLSDPTGMRKLIEPGARLDQISPGLIGLCQCLAFYFWGVPLSRLGMWTGLHKSTLWRALTSLGVLLYEPIYEEIHRRVRLGIALVDEKWIKIKGEWHYWFV